MKTLKQIIILIFLLNTQCDGISYQNTNTSNFITLNECIKIGLTNNRDIKKKDLDVKISEHYISTNMSEFDPILSLSADYSYSLYPYSDSNGEREEYKYLIPTSSFEISKNLESGGNISIGHKSEINKELSSDSVLYKNGLYLNISHPLLDGFGISLNRRGIKQSEINRDIEEKSLLLLINGIIANTQNAYWDLALAYKNYEIMEKLINHTKEQAKQFKELISLGVQSESEIVILDERMAYQEKGLVSARQNIDYALNNLKVILGIEDNNAIYKPIDNPEDNLAKLKNQDQLFEIASENSFDIAQQKLAINNLMLDMEYYKNKIYPSLFLNASLSLSGEDDRFIDSLTNFGTKRDYYTGLTLNIPLGNRQAESDYIIAKARLDRAKLDLINIKRDLFINLENIYNEIVANEKNYSLSQKILDLSSKKLTQEEEKFNLGRSTLRYLVDFQKDLENSTLEAFASLIDLVKSHVRLQRILGINIFDFGKDKFSGRK